MYVHQLVCWLNDSTKCTVQRWRKKTVCLAHWMNYEEITDYRFYVELLHHFIKKVEITQQCKCGNNSFKFESNIFHPEVFGTYL